MSLGVGPGTVVAILIPRSPIMVVALLGIMKAGGAYLPLETTLPAARITFMLRDSGAKVLLTQPDFAQRLAQGSCIDKSMEVVVVTSDSLGPAAAASARWQGGSRTGPSDLACIIYTSGSTGTPKGVAIKHEGKLCPFRSCMHCLVHATRAATLAAGRLG